VLIASRSGEIQNELTIRNTLLAQKIIPDLVTDIGDYYTYAYPTYVDFTQKLLTDNPDILRFKIYNPDEEEIFDTDTAGPTAISPQQPIPTNDSAVLKVFASKKNLNDIVTLNKQQAIRIIVPYIDKYGTFRMVIEFYFSLREVRQAVQQVIIFSIIMLLSATGVSVILTILLVNQITAPILRLTNAVSEIGKGNMNVTIDTHSQDEIGQLATAFNQMTKDLQQSHTKLESYSKDLENQVAKRTEELQRQMEEMQRLQKLTIDRELKMVELKKEIETLKRNPQPTIPSSAPEPPIVPPIISTPPSVTPPIAQISTAPVTQSSSDNSTPPQISATPKESTSPSIEVSQTAPSTPASPPDTNLQPEKIT